MKYILLFAFFFTQSVMAFPFLGEYKACEDEQGDIVDAYVHLVDFAEEGLGFQLAVWPRMSSMLIHVDKTKHITNERLSGYEFEYQSDYQNGVLSLNFSSASTARLLGFNTNFTISYSEDIIGLTFDGIKIFCQKEIRN